MFFFILLLSLLSSVRTSTFYVSPTGNDEDSGSENEPWNTVTFSVNQLSPGDTVLLRGGIFNEKNVDIDLQGTETAPITIKNYPGENPIVDGSLVDFRESENSMWEPVSEHSDIFVYKSINIYPDFEQAYAYLWLDENGKETMKLIPYETGGSYDAWHHFISREQSYSTTNGIYCGPGVYWNETDEHVYIRLQHSDIEIQMGINEPPVIDPRQNKIFVFNSGQIFQFQAGSAYINVEGIEFRHQNNAIELKNDCHDISIRESSVMGGRYHILVREKCYNLEFSSISCNDSVPPWVSWHDVKDIASGRPVHKFQMSFINLDNGTHDVEISNCVVKNVFDVIDAANCVWNVFIHDNYFEGIRDDVLQLGVVSYNVHVFNNMVLGQAKGPSRNGNGYSKGSKFIYGNVFDNRKEDLQFRIGYPDYNDENGGFVNRSIFGGHGTDQWSIDPWKIYHNTIFVGEMRNNNWNRVGISANYGLQAGSEKQEVYNNIFCVVGDHFFEYKLHTDESKLIFDGNLYFRQFDGEFTQPFFAYVYKDSGASMKHFQSLNEFKNDTEGFLEATKQYYAPGWENLGLEGDPQLDENYIPNELGPAATMGVDLSQKNFPGITEGMNYRGAFSPYSDDTNIEGTQFQLILGLVIGGSVLGVVIFIIFVVVCVFIIVFVVFGKKRNSSVVGKTELNEFE